MYFGGKLIKNVPFVTMFKNTFEGIIPDSASLFNLLLCHLMGISKEIVSQCSFCTPNENRYEQAMKLLKNRYGDRLGVIHAHQQEILAGKTINESISDFSKVSNELGCFQKVLSHYNTEETYFSEDLVKKIVSDRMNLKLCSESTNYMHNKGLLGNPNKYLPERIKWLDRSSI